MSKNCCKPKGMPNGTGGVDKFILSIVIGTIAVLVGVVYLGTKMAQTAVVEADQNVVMEVDEMDFSWGTIGINDGNVEKTFTIANSGSNTLKLYGVKTSCMCTTAQIITSEGASRIYKMHESSTEVMEIPAGETAEIRVIFDPLYHGPSGVGPVTRMVTINTNDPKTPVLNFRLAAMVAQESL
jgi:hypothetical protein